VDVIRRERTTGGVLNPKGGQEVGEGVLQILSGTTALQIVNIQGITSLVRMHALLAVKNTSIATLAKEVALEVGGTIVHLGWK